MKKGLRRAEFHWACCEAGPALRPDEEGIKTLANGWAGRRGRPALRPDEEGIKTVSPAANPAVARRPALRPDEEGIKTRPSGHTSQPMPSGLET